MLSLRVAPRRNVDRSTLKKPHHRHRAIVKVAQTLSSRNIINLLLFALITLCFASRASAQALNNPGFEAPYTNGIASGWTLALDTGGAASGSQLTNGADVDAGASSQRITVTAVGGGKSALRQNVTLLKAATYRASIRLRSSNAIQVRFVIRRDTSSGEGCATSSLVVGSSWTTYAIEGGFSDNANVDAYLGIEFKSTGTLDVDTASLTNITSSTSVALTSPIPRSLFGIHINKYGTYVTWPQIRQGMFRLWDSNTKWLHLEPSQDNWNWSGIDGLVNAAKLNDPNCEIIYTMGQTPAWAGPGATQAPTDLDDWRDYVRQVATRYKGKIKYYEIWNEVNHPTFWTGTKQQMLDLTIAAYEELKDVDPSIQVLSPNVTSSGLTWMDDFLLLGGSAYFDILSFHKYGTDLNPENDFGYYAGIRSLMSSYGISAFPLWITEGARGSSTTVTNDQAKGVVARSFATIWLAGGVNWNWYGWDIFFGSNPIQLTTDNINPAPAGVAYRETVAWLTGATATARSIDGNGTWVVELSRPGGYQAQMVWNPTQTPSYNISGLGFTRMRDLSGTTTSVNGVGSITAGVAPVLLENQTPPPQAPTGLKALAVSPTQINLSWPACSDTASYTVQRSLTPGGPYSTVASGIAGASYSDTTVAAHTRYHYVVLSVNTGGSSSPSNEAEDATGYVVDNADGSGVVITGSWTSGTKTPIYYGSNYIHDGNTGGAGGKSVRFSPNLSQSGTYDVYVRWTAETNRASNTPIDVIHAGGTDTFAADQRIDGSQWRWLGTFAFNAGTSGSVLVRNDGANGYVLADAVKFVQVYDIVKDNTDGSGITVTGTWTPSTSTSGYYGSNYLHDGNTSKGSKSVRFTPNLPIAGSASVYMRWPAHVNRANNVPIDVIHAGGTTTVTVDQTTNGGIWYYLGTYSFNAGTSGSVLIRTSGTTNYVVADAVRFEKY